MAEELLDCVMLDGEMPVLCMAHAMLVRDAAQESIPTLGLSNRLELPTIAARMGMPYFVDKTPGASRFSSLSASYSTIVWRQTSA